MSAEPLIDSTEYQVLSWIISRLTPRRLLYSAIFGAVFSLLAWLLPKYLAYLYMRHFGFYDFEFMESSLANSIVLVNFFIILPAFIGLGLLVYFIRKFWSNNKVPSILLILVILIVLGLLLYAAITAPLLQLIIFFGIVAFVATALYIFFERKKIALLFTIFAIPIIFISLIFFNDSLVYSYGEALKQNGLGGFLADIELTVPLDKNRINFPSKNLLHNEGKLIQAHIALIAPNNIYITTNQWLPNSKKNYIHRAIIPKNNVLLISPHISN